MFSHNKYKKLKYFLYLRFTVSIKSKQHVSERLVYSSEPLFQY